MQIAVLGIDLGKNSCGVVGLDTAGQVILRRRLHRDSVAKLASRLPACVVAMEACCGAHHLGHVLQAWGHEIRLMSPEYVQPYVKAQKNDERDAEAIAEAATRPTMRFVELKNQEHRHAEPAQGSRPLGERAHRADQSTSRHAARARHHRRTGAAKVGADLLALDSDDAPPLPMSARMRCCSMICARSGVS